MTDTMTLAAMTIAAKEAQIWGLKQLSEAQSKTQAATDAQLAAKDVRIKQLVAAQDIHHGTPCEQMRHEEELAFKNAKLAELQLRNTSLRVERDDLYAQLAVKDAEIAHLAECLILSLGSIEEGVLVRNVRAQLAAKDAERDGLRIAQKEPRVTNGQYSTAEWYQIGRNDALEEAAKMAEDDPRRPLRIAAAIRALKTEPK